jgi:hypothetical protein
MSLPTFPSPVGRVFRPGAIRTVLLLAALALSPVLPTANGGAPLQVAAVDAVGLTVSDMDRALAFYTR